MFSLTAIVIVLLIAAVCGIRSLWRLAARALARLQAVPAAGTAKDFR